MLYVTLTSSAFVIVQIPIMTIHINGMYNSKNYSLTCLEACPESSTTDTHSCIRHIEGHLCLQRMPVRSPIIASRLFRFLFVIVQHVKSSKSSGELTSISDITLSQVISRRASLDLSRSMDPLLSEHSVAISLLISLPISLMMYFLKGPSDIHLLARA